MPTLKYFAAAGAPRLYAVHKPVTTIGKALGNDVPVAGAGVAEHHAQAGYLLRQPFGLGLTVPARDADQQEQARAYLGYFLPLYRNGGGLHPLEDYPHGLYSGRRPA